ncbi:hypothetical protein BKA62DRAFT_714887, partial [Auriculariales sp. MPI-PUGE-AT-0066]
MRRMPKEVTYEFVQAPTYLIIQWRQARLRFHESIFNWWNRTGKRHRGLVPTDEEYELAKSDPEILAAGKELDELEAKLDDFGTIVKVATIKNERDVPRQMRTEERILNKAYQDELRNAEQQSLEERSQQPNRQSLTPLSIIPTGHLLPKNRSWLWNQQLVHRGAGALRRLQLNRLLELLDNQPLSRLNNGRLALQHLPSLRAQRVQQLNQISEHLPGARPATALPLHQGQNL